MFSMVRVLSINIMRNIVDVFEGAKVKKIKLLKSTMKKGNKL